MLRAVCGPHAPDGPCGLPTMRHAGTPLMPTAGSVTGSRVEASGTFGKGFPCGWAMLARASWNGTSRERVTPVMNFSDQEYFPPRRKTRPVKVGRLTIGGDAAIVVQSMTKTDTRDVTRTVEQIEQMEAAGCEIVRLAVPDQEAAEALPEIRKRCPDSILVSDIHFQHKFALMALDAGIDKLRINPGNMGMRKRFAPSSAAPNR